MDFNKDFGILIRCYREKKELSQENLAKKAKLSRTSLTNIEAGRQSCTLDTAFELANSLEIQMSEIQQIYFKYLLKSKLASYSTDIQSEVSQHLGIG